MAFQPPLLTNTPTKQKYGTADTEWCLSAGSGADFSATGTSASYGVSATPDAAVTCTYGKSGVGANVSIDFVRDAAVLTGRMTFVTYQEWFEELPASTAYNYTSIAFRGDEDGGFSAPYLSRSLNIGPQWQTTTIGREIFANAGTELYHPMWKEGSTGTSSFANNYQKIRLTITNTTGIGNKLWVAQIVDNAQWESRLLLLFDDCYDSVYTIAYPYMAARGLVGVLGCISSAIGTAGFMTEAQVSELVAAGWTVANHTTTHLPVQYNNSRAYWDAEIGTCHDYITTRWGAPTSFVSPYGDFLRRSATDYRAAVEAVYDVSWGTIDGQMVAYLPGGHYLPRMNVRTHSGGVTAAGHVARIRSIVASGSSAALMFHKFIASGPTGDDTELVDDDFYTIIDEIYRYHAAGLTKVVTDKQFVADCGGVGYNRLLSA